MRSTLFRQITGFTLLISLLLAVTACSNNVNFTETFETPGDWRTGSDSDVDGAVQDGVYDFLVKADDMVIWTTAAQDFGDAIYEVEATQVGGPDNNGYGMLFRVDDENDHFYLFEISGDGFVWIGRYRSGGDEEAEPLVGDWWFESDAVKQGPNQTNRLKVEAEGANMIFYVNDQEVGRVTDDAFKRGDIGLLVRTLGEGDVHVQFDNFTVTPIR